MLAYRGNSSGIVCSKALSIGICLTIAGMFVSDLGAQTDLKSRSSANNLPKTHVPKAGYLTGPFNPNVENVGVEFRGHDIASIVSALVALDKVETKSEFETTDQFEKRQQLAQHKPILGSLRVDSTLAFVVPATSDNHSAGFHAQYDADSKLMHISLQFSSTTFYLEPGNPTFDTLELERKVLSQAKYVGSNAFGVQKTVTSSLQREYGIALAPDTEGISSQPEQPMLKFDIGMGAEEARSVKQRLGMLIVCFIRQSKPLKDVSGREATIDDPFEYADEESYIYIQADGFWVYDTKSGDVIRKLTTLGETADQGNVAQDAAARKDFAERVRGIAAKVAGGELPPGGNVSADGPDATFFAFHQRGVTLSQCNALFEKYKSRPDALPYLRKLGFTYFVCTDDGNTKFTFDLATQSFVGAQSSIPTR